MSTLWNTCQHDTCPHTGRLCLAGKRRWGYVGSTSASCVWTFIFITTQDDIMHTQIRSKHQQQLSTVNGATQYSMNQLNYKWNDIKYTSTCCFYRGHNVPVVSVVVSRRSDSVTALACPSSFNVPTASSLNVKFVMYFVTFFDWLRIKISLP